MPWTNQGGSNDAGPSGPRGPWGRGPAGGRPSQGLDDLIRRGVDRIRRLMPDGPFSRNSLTAIAAALVGLWFMSGIYFVAPDEQGVVLRFGAVSALTEPGMRYHLPWPIEVAYAPKVRNTNKINVGYSDEDGSSAGDVTEESHMLTGDENIVDVNFTVYWKINDAPAFLFNVPNQEATIKAVAESAMREVVGESQIERIQTLDRAQMQVSVRELMQRALDLYRMGVTITDVNMQKADPPAEVIGAYRDVQAARADQDRKRNEAEGYANTIVPQARGRAAHIVQDAEAYRQKVIAEASGQSKRFLSVYAEYRKAPEVTRRRMYLDNLSQILGPVNKVIVDDSVKGMVPYLQLPKAEPQTAPGPNGAVQGQMMLSDPNAQRGDGQ
ncbi:MAG: FtsH protease activity modulator HflK [Alphaproteobacteria bacterium]|nr:FtsH protease activity modulator HflK [Alphaproteobacteria bacterium]MBV9692841.1 FtsH protease activity modulator HflK [Alphaproteobacteria bacterium]